MLGEWDGHGRKITLFLTFSRWWLISVRRCPASARFYGCQLQHCWNRYKLLKNSKLQEASRPIYLSIYIYIYVCIYIYIYVFHYWVYQSLFVKLLLMLIRRTIKNSKYEPPSQMCPSQNTIYGYSYMDIYIYMGHIYIYIWYYMVIPPSLEIPKNLYINAVIDGYPPGTGLIFSNLWPWRTEGLVCVIIPHSRWVSHWRNIETDMGGFSQWFPVDFLTTMFPWIPMCRWGCPKIGVLPVIIHSIFGFPLA